MNLKEIAKFFSGFTAGGTIVHLWLAFSGLLPITWFGIITLTPTINTIQIIGWAVIRSFWHITRGARNQEHPNEWPAFVDDYGMIRSTNRRVCCLECGRVCCP